MKKNNYTQGSIIKSLLAISIPIIMANILQTVYNLTDTFWVGRLGAEAIAAVSLSFPVIFLLISLGGGLAIAGSIFVAQYKGKGEKEIVNHISAQTFLVSIFIAIIVSIVGYFISPLLMRIMGAEKAVLPSAVAYLQISFIGHIFLFGFFVFQALMRGVGDVKTPMYIVLGTALLNFILDPLFIFGYGAVPAYGVSGAAIATILTQCLATIIGISMLFSGKYEIVLKKKNFKLDFSLIKKMVKLGLPASLEQSSRAFGLILITFIVASFGTKIVAVYGIGTRILSFIIIPALGIGMAASTLVGQNIGAGKIERAEKTSKISIILGFISLTLAGILIFIFAKQITKIFIPGDIEIIKESALFVRIMALTFGFIGVDMIIEGVFRGAGNTLASMTLAIVNLFVLRLPLVYILSKHTALKETGIYWAFAIANIAIAIIALIWYKKGTWKNKKITEEIKMDACVKEEVIIEEGQ